MNVGAVVEWAARRHAGALAFKDAERELSFAQAYDEARRLAAGLRRLGIGRGDRVGLLMNNQVAFPVCEFAVDLLGAVRVPMLVNAGADEVRYCVEHAGMSLLFADDEGLAAARAALAASTSTVALVRVGRDGAAEECTAGLAAGEPLPAREEPTGGDLHALRYTGGTTGLPKGVMMDHASFRAGIVVNPLLNWPISSGGACLHIHPLSHAAGLFLYPMWAAGAANVFTKAFGFDPDRFCATIERERATSAWVVPTVLYEVLDSGAVSRHDLSSLECVFYGGAPMHADRLRQAVGALGPRFIQTYGCSEAPMTLSTLAREDHVVTGDPAVDRRLASAGRPSFNVDLHVVREDGAVCEPEEVGEIVTRGAHVTPGYWKDPALTAQRHRDGWFHTGDLGLLDSTGYLHVTGRKDDLLITGGFNVYPAEIEQALESHPSVGEACVFGLPHRKWGDAVVAVVQGRDGAVPPTADELVAHVRAALPGHKVPKAVLVVDAPFPRSAVGKTLRRAVRDRHVAALESLLR